MDLIGKHFGKLTAHSNPDEQGTVLCECECGEIKLVNYGSLLNGRACSCGNKGCRVKFQGGCRDKVFGTSIGRISSKKISKNSKTGVRGVSYNEKVGKYEAYIYFRGKKIHLGLYDKLVEAATEREKAEDTYYAPVISEFASLAMA